MKHDIQAMAHQALCEAAKKKHDAAERAVKRFYKCDDVDDAILFRVKYSLEGGKDVLRDIETNAIIIAAHATNVVSDGDNVSLKVNYQTFDNQE